MCLGWEQGDLVQEEGGAAAKPREERGCGKEAVSQGCVWRSGWRFNIEKNRCADLVIGRSVVGSLELAWTRCTRMEVRMENTDK